ncbi:hypothetical protein SAMN05216316_0316 [Nitrosovibrio sp. Nv6]|nr:hypothetical protein SAMN05216316_0316 [Nitrosovibrio sp. Nv6]
MGYGTLHGAAGILVKIGGREMGMPCRKCFPASRRAWNRYSAAAPAQDYFKFGSVNGVDAAA